MRTAHVVPHNRVCPNDLSFIGHGTMSISTTTTSSGTEPSVGQSTHPQNQYYVCLQYQEEPIAWNPYTERGAINEHTAYFGGIFQALEQHFSESGLTFYFTWRLDELPRYGEDVVAVVMGDEWGRYPLYADKVRAVFKMLGTDYPLEVTPFQTPASLAAVTTLKYVRTQMMRLPYLAQAWRDRLRGGTWTGETPVPIFNIPVGYANQEELPLKPFWEREHDLYFSGSVSNKVYPWYTAQHWLRTPKDVARSSMVHAMRELQDDRPDLHIEIDTRSSYVPQSKERGKNVTERSYSEMMMDTRICPVPRGTQLETPRLFEALRYGCVVITEPLPDRWYTRELPAVVVHDWADMPEVVSDLVDDANRLEALHEASLQWWEDMCSEEAVGQYMADQLNGVFDDASTGR